VFSREPSGEVEIEQSVINIVVGPDEKHGKRCEKSDE
jgi:hypothetical protein